MKRDPHESGVKVSSEDVAMAFRFFDAVHNLFYFIHKTVHKRRFFHGKLQVTEKILRKKLGCYQPKGSTGQIYQPYRIG